MTIEIPGYRPGTYTIDPAHSEVSFSVRHMMISKVKGAFHVIEGTIVAPENPLDASVTAKADVASISTKDEGRDQHLRSADFFDAEQFPTIEFVSTGVREQDGHFLVDGDLTIHGVTQQVTFTVEFGGFGVDPWGNYKAGATGSTTIDRESFGLAWNAALETGGVLVGKDVTIALDLQAIHQA